MNTPWTSERRRELDALLRSCVECGFCLPYCATWLQSGNEVHSPRGRLLLLARHLDGSLAEQELRASLDLCIGCMACTATCPSGGPFTLLDQGKQAMLAGAPGPVVHRLDNRAVLRWIGRAARFLRVVFRLVLGEGWRTRLGRAPLGLAALARKLGQVPATPGDDRALERLLTGLVKVASDPTETTGEPQIAQAPPGPTGSVLGPGQEVIFFLGCANSGLLPGTSVRLRELLAACGCRVVIPGGQDCCGALATHTGRPGRAAAIAVAINP